MVKATWECHMVKYLNKDESNDSQTSVNCASDNIRVKFVTNSKTLNS